MIRNPTADELLGAVIAWLRDASPAPNDRFSRRVAANALAIVRREQAQGDRSDRAGAARMATLLGHDGDHDALVGELCAAIRSGAIADDDPRLIEHLTAATLDAIAIDQPRYVHELTRHPSQGETAT